MELDNRGFRSSANLSIHIASVPTSVWTIDIRYDLISETRPKMSTNSWSRMCCKSLSRAMKVPVRPTPALQKKVQMARESQQASVLLEVNRKCLKLPRWGKTLLTECLPLSCVSRMQTWLVLLGCHIFDHH